MNVDLNLLKTGVRLGHILLMFGFGSILWTHFENTGTYNVSGGFKNGVLSGLKKKINELLYCLKNRAKIC